jgi:hypothetical protein
VIKCRLPNGGDNSSHSSAVVLLVEMSRRSRWVSKGLQLLMSDARQSEVVEFIPERIKCRLVKDRTHTVLALQDHEC